MSVMSQNINKILRKHINHEPLWMSLMHVVHIILQVYSFMDQCNLLYTFEL